ncbi:hypothetical protein Scep_029745 [Stephania cephalantha]|uniref:Uncharacterized protein n=1 Tax=Stephania cephalantha TaxID=152367 RepID=A0AAP0E5Y8_9MAGN
MRDSSRIRSTTEGLGSDQPLFFIPTKSSFFIISYLRITPARLLHPSQAHLGWMSTLLHPSAREKKKDRRECCLFRQVMKSRGAWDELCRGTVWRNLDFVWFTIDPPVQSRKPTMWHSVCHISDT